jgi:hypothetical protein
MQSFISCTALSFAMFMLYIGKDPGIYLPIVTSIISYWMPSPIYTSPKPKSLELPPSEEPLLSNV